MDECPVIHDRRVRINISHTFCSKFSIRVAYQINIQKKQRKVDIEKTISRNKTWQSTATARSLEGCLMRETATTPKISYIFSSSLHPHLSPPLRQCPPPPLTTRCTSRPSHIPSSPPTDHVLTNPLLPTNRLRTNRPSSDDSINPNEPQSNSKNSLFLFFFFLR